MTVYVFTCKKNVFSIQELFAAQGVPQKNSSGNFNKPDARKTTSRDFSKMPNVTLESANLAHASA